MAEAVNAARGEVALKIDDVELVIATTMAGLSALSTRLQCKSLADLFIKLSSVEITATVAAIDCLTIRGDKAEALNKLRLFHFSHCATAFEEALSAQLEDRSGNETAVEVKTEAAKS